jgi:hypothetical protein
MAAMKKVGQSEVSGQDQFLLYTAPDGAVKVDVFVKDETVWLTQKALAELFGVKVPAINKHLKNIFDSGELVEAAVISVLETTASDGKDYKTRYYNLDAIIAVGYRVNSYQATQFRIWATNTLREFIIKGFVLDDERLLLCPVGGLQRGRAPDQGLLRNRAEQAALGDHGADGRELIYGAADATKFGMGLTTWKQAPHGKILKSDGAVAKNYLSEAHVKELNRIVSAYLDLAENRAQRGIVMKMADWADFLDGFLKLSNYPILADKGKVSALEAKLKAEREYEVYRQCQDAEYVSDFDREIQRIEGKKPSP